MEHMEKAPASLLLLLGSLKFFFYGVHGVHGEGPASLLLLLDSLELFSTETASPHPKLRREWEFAPLCGAAMTFSHCSKDPSRP